MAWINRIKYKVDENTTEQVFPLGTTFDKVYSDQSKAFSLENLANSLKTFFSRPAFMIYSTETPNNNSNVVEFYYVTGEGIDTRFNGKF